jgi:hypothetical protein
MRGLVRISGRWRPFTRRSLNVMPSLPLGVALFGADLPATAGFGHGRILDTSLLFVAGTVTARPEVRQIELSAADYGI